uniref:Uncharacterized protein n=1 Tax=Cacopsylla melanoneura TaxID=428564 RepID=A0A8D9FDJ7_9HEMI
MTSFSIPGLWLSIYFVRLNFAFPIFWSRILKGTVLFFSSRLRLFSRKSFYFFSRIIPKHFVSSYSYVPFLSSLPPPILSFILLTFYFLFLLYSSFLFSCPVLSFVFLFLP